MAIDLCMHCLFLIFVFFCFKKQKYNAFKSCALDVLEFFFLVFVTWSVTIDKPLWSNLGFMVHFLNQFKVVLGLGFC